MIKVDVGHHNCVKVGKSLHGQSAILHKAAKICTTQTVHKRFCAQLCAFDKSLKGN